MRFDPDKHYRHSIRLKGYDYTQYGAYFATIVTQTRSLLLGDVADGDMLPNAAGRMVQAVWDELPAFYPGVLVDEFVVMPNHIHGIIVLVGAAPRGRPGPSANGRPDPDFRVDPGWSDRPPLVPDEPTSLITDRLRGSERGEGQARGPAPTGLAGPALAPEPEGVQGEPGMTLADVVHRFKTMTTKRYADGVKQLGWPAFRGRLWQRNYYEHIIRNEPARGRIRRYVDTNPARWAFDDENPLKVSG